MVTRTYGPFDYYKDKYADVTGDRIREAVDPVNTNLTSLTEISEDLRGDERELTTQAEGDIRESLVNKAGMPQTVINQLIANGHFAAGCMRLLAQHVDSFDTTVNSLNVRYNGRVQAAHRIPELRDEITDWSAYREEVRAGIAPEWQNAWNLVESQGDDVAAMFADGAQNSDIRTLILAGLIPFEARGYWPTVTFTEAELERLLLPEYEKSLRDAGVIGPDTPDGLFMDWMENAARNGVNPSEMVRIAQQADLDENSFDFMSDWEQVQDNDGKTYFFLPRDVSSEDAMRGTLLTYIFNANTGYADADGHENNDFPATPYSAAEVERIMNRQEANKWSYGDHGWFKDKVVPDLMDHRAHPQSYQVTTPNGVMMGVGGPTAWSQRGGTMYGDLFWVNWDGDKEFWQYVDDPKEQFREMIEDGYMHFPSDDFSVAERGGNDLDRVLHHEERHARQWTHNSTWYMATHNDEIEEDAGLSDGGY